MFLSFSLISLELGIIFATYQNLPAHHKLLRRGCNAIPWLDLLLLPVVRFLEPEGFNWFPKWSSGKLAILIYSISCTFTLFFISSNLRMILIAKKYEKPMITEEDVLNRGKGVYIMWELGEFK